MTLLDRPVPVQHPALELISFETPAIHNLGIVASMGKEINPVLFKEARELRAKVYIDEKGFLSEEARSEDGGESDQEDDRSVHFVVTESSTSEEGRTSHKVIGTSRLIVKRAQDDSLPVEQFFDVPQASGGSLEVSRYIARHEDRTIQQLASIALIIGMTNEATARKAESVYAIVERPLEVRFKWLGMPLQRIAEPRHLEEYNTENIAIKFDPFIVLQGMRTKRPKEYNSVINSVGGI